MTRRAERLRLSILWIALTVMACGEGSVTDPSPEPDPDGPEAGFVIVEGSVFTGPGRVPVVGARVARLPQTRWIVE
jgi:hypothetical protein